MSPAVFGAEARQESGVLYADRRARAVRALMEGRSDADLLPGGKALELIEAAAITAPRAAVAAATALPQQVVARDVVLAAARAEADTNGVVTRERIVAATAQVKTGTRDKALTDLVADGLLRRIKNGVYALA